MSPQRSLTPTLVMKPRVLLLDEPTAQLDPVAEKNFLHALFRVNRELGCTVVVATHRPEPMVDYASDAFRIEGGRLSALDNLEELRSWDRLPGALRGELAAARIPLGAQESDCRAGAIQASPDRLPRGARAGDDATVELRRAWFRYERDGAWVLRGLDARIATGSIHALVGGNGCGKSTLLLIMAGIQALQQGSLSRRPASKALLPQDPRALFATERVEDELMEWAPAVGYGQRDVDAMLARLGLAEARERHPYDLSGGQQQLLALGKLALIQPELLLLDEPTKGLDAGARTEVARFLLRERERGTTVVMASHDLEFVQVVADRVSMVFDGEIASTEPSEDFFKNNVYYRP